jgi:hypothetical protein
MKKFLLTLGFLFALAAEASAQKVFVSPISTAGADCSTVTRCAILVERQLQNLEAFSIYVDVGTSGTFEFEATTDGTTWFGESSSSGDASTSADGNFHFVNKGFVGFRVRASAISGAATITYTRGWGGSTGAVSITGDSATDLSDMADDLDYIRNNGALDGTHDLDSPETGPLIHGECDDTGTDPVDEGDSGKSRIDCITRALVTTFIDPCSAVAKTTTAISLTADTVIIAAVASKKNYICSISIVAGAAEIVSITEGTGSTCGTNEAALAGSTTDANGMSFAANGGIAANGGNATVIAGITANVDTCMNVSGSNRVSGFVTWVQK